MFSAHPPCILVEKTVLASGLLDREIKIDFYIPRHITDTKVLDLLLINDGQDLETMDFPSMLEKLYNENAIRPVLCVGIHAGPERRREYGVASQPDYKDRGDRAGLYTRFIFQELFPYIHSVTGVSVFGVTGFAGFSLGGLSALDISWHHPSIFSTTAVFSGSLWWRSLGQEEEDYDDDQHRIMHQEIRKGQFAPGHRFYFQCGNMDETRDRNKNGIIDSIDDTLDLIKELEAKGYRRDIDIRYLLLEDGRHDVKTWGRAFPDFLKWGFGPKVE